MRRDGTPVFVYRRRDCTGVLQHIVNEAQTQLGHFVIIVRDAAASTPGRTLRAAGNSRAAHSVLIHHLSLLLSLSPGILPPQLPLFLPSVPPLRSI